MKSGHPQGFTLVELLTVIAIIAILAGLTFTMAGPMREKGKLTKLASTFHNVDLAMKTYYADNDTYPPGYGFLKFPDEPAGGSPYYLKPYTAMLGRHNTGDVVDLFSESGDGTRDNTIDPTEFLPLGNRVADGPPQFILDQRYPEAGLPDEISRQLTSGPRPLYYAPVNSEQYTRAKRYWLKVYATEKSNGQLEATSWDPADPELSNLNFPAVRYDAFALVSVGPIGHYQGVVAAGEEYQAYLQWLFSTYPNRAYHILALRTYYLAMRDLNDNKKKDFDFDARKTGEASWSGQVTLRSGQAFAANNNLPSTQFTNGYGPVLFTNK